MITACFEAKWFNITIALNANKSHVTMKEDGRIHRIEHEPSNDNTFNDIIDSLKYCWEKDGKWLYVKIGNDNGDRSIWLFHLDEGEAELRKIAILTDNSAEFNDAMASLTDTDKVSLYTAFT